MIDAVVDRIVDGKHLVVLVGKEEREHIVPLSVTTTLFKEGDWVSVAVDDQGTITKIELNQSKTMDQARTIQHKMAALRAKKGSRFKS